jgi:hypothetical protein
MLTMPESNEPFRLLSIDPGTMTMGITLWEWHVGTHAFRIVECFTLEAKDNNPLYDSVGETYGKRIARLMNLGDLLLNTLLQFRPHAVIAESPFLGRFPQAFAGLIECIVMIRNMVFRYDPFLPLCLVDPPTAKKAAGVAFSKKSTKEDVKHALQSRRDIDWGDVLTDDLDEHSIDSVAVGIYYFLFLV